MFNVIFIFISSLKNPLIFIVNLNDYANICKLFLYDYDEKFELVENLTIKRINIAYVALKTNLKHKHNKSKCQKLK